MSTAAREDWFRSNISRVSLSASTTGVIARSRIGLRGGIVLQALAHAVELQSVAAEAHVFDQRLPGVARMEDERRHVRQLGPALRPVLQAEIAALLRMHGFEMGRAVDLEDGARCAPA